MRTLLNKKGVKTFVHIEGDSKIGNEGLETLEKFIKDALVVWCKDSKARKRRILTKETCPIELDCFYNG